MSRHPEKEDLDSQVVRTNYSNFESPVGSGEADRGLVQKEGLAQRNLHDRDLKSPKT